MSPKAPKACCEVGCTKLVYDSGTRCDRHRKEAATRAWKNTDPKRSGTADHKRRAARVLKRDGYQCQIRYVGTCIGQANQLDHIVPLYLGGQDTDANTRAACGPCHAAHSSDQGNQAQGHQVRTRPRQTPPDTPHDLDAPRSTDTRIPRRIETTSAPADHDYRPHTW